MMIKSKQSLAEKERARIEAQVTDGSSFIARNVVLNYLLLFILYPIAAIYSAFTQGSALFVYLDRVINNALAAVVFTVIVAVVIEVAKFFFGKAVSDDTRHHVWTESRHHVIAFILKLTAFVGVFAFSITLSLTGAPDVAEGYREQVLPVESKLISTDSINAYFDAKIQAERADIAAASNMTWRGSIVKDGREVIKTAKANIKDYENQKADALADAAQANNATIAEYNKETAQAGNWLTGFAGLGEFMALLILFFSGNYAAGAEKEVFSSTSTDQGPTQSVTNAITQASNASNNATVDTPYYTTRPAIGFVIPSPKEPATPPPPPATTGDHCQHCGKGFERKTSWQKFCSTECRMSHHAAKNNGRRFDPTKYRNKS